VIGLPIGQDALRPPLVSPQSKHEMATNPATERLTTWAAAGDTRIAELVRTTLGPLALMVVTPIAAILFWIVCTFAPFDGSLLPLLSVEGWRAVVAHIPAPSPAAVEIILLFAVVEAVLLQWLPGTRYEGPVTPAGNRPVYKLNGVAAWFVTHALFFGCSYGLGWFNAGIVWDHFGSILATLVPFALAFCLFLYFKGRYRPTTQDRSVSGNFIWDYYWGVELHPTLFAVNLKQLVNCRLSMMGWSVIVCSFAAKQAELSGHVSSSMLVSVTITVVYLFKFFWWESGYFTSLDIMHDRFGYYICWGVLSWVPAVYALTAQYLVLRPHDLPLPIALSILVLGLGAIYLNYAVDEQRQRVRASGGKTTIWGRAPELIRARYTTADGTEHESLLLASGWWGVARHFHYVPEITLALAWSLPAGFTHVVPYVYVIFLTILLTDRATRDDRRCSKKYGTCWDEYRRRVPWKIVPGVY
jgi:7-dehydrocholesterol reductase